MLKDHASSAILAVSDLARARAFYEDVLGLEPDGAVEDDSPVVYRTGTTHLVIYPSTEAGSNRANAVVWGLGDRLAAEVEELRARGVAFERYDLPGADYRDGVHWFGDFAAVWFKDPDGNILHINSAR